MPCSDVPDTPCLTTFLWRNHGMHFQVIFPIGFMTATDVMLSNISFKYVTVTFYTIVKSSTLVSFGVVCLATTGSKPQASYYVAQRLTIISLLQVPYLDTRSMKPIQPCLVSSQVWILLWAICFRIEKPTWLMAATCVVIR